jgi:hypothetical protein
VTDVYAIAEDSWTRANQRALETALVVTVFTFAASTFIRRPRKR